MSLPTCAVLCSVFDDAGNPVAGATITAKLNQFEVYGGYVVPMDVSGTTDSTGTCTLNLWPNALGSTESMYAVKIVSPNGKTLRTSAVVPHTTSANLHQIAELPAYDGKTDGQLILTDAVTAGATAVSAATAASGSATAAAGSATAALASQTAAAASQASAAVYSANASGFATAASASAGAAGTSATAAASSAATATTKASESAASAITSAASAATSTTKAGESAASATTSTAQAVIATTQAGNASTSAAASSGSATASALSASASEASRIAAGLSAAAAAVSATSAGTSAASASGSASTASTKATESASSATASAASAVTATAQAVIATTQAGYASTSEANALIYSVTATTKATAAQISASLSADSANSSAASATASAGSAANALSTYTSMVGVYGSITAVNTAVTNAGNSATAAAASAASALSIYGSTSAVSAAVSAASGSATAAANSATAAAASAVTAAGYTVPSQTGNGGKFLTTNGTAVSWDNALTAVAANTYGILKLVGNSRGGEIDFYANSTALGSFWVDASANMMFGTGASFTERARIDSGGNFGIGKTPGNEKLGIKLATETNFAYGLNVVRSGNDSFFGIGYNSAADAWQIGATYQSTGAYKPVTLWTSGSERLRVGTNGNVGIGKTSSGGLLEMQLPSDANYSYGINLFRLANDSQFGIGYNSASDVWQIAASFGTTGAYKPIAFSVNSVERVRFDTSGNVLVGKTSATANAGDVQLSKGVAFPATQVSCSDANTLDDYEEGTWTPAITLGGGNTGITYASQTGTYTKVGNLVTVQFGVVLSSKGSSTGGVQITGLPFVGKTGVNHNLPAPFSTNMVSSTSVGAAITTASSVIQLYNSQTNYSATLQDTGINNNTSFSLTFSYYTNT